MLWGIAFAVLMVLALLRARSATASFSADFRTLKSRGETFQVDWATGIIRGLNQSMEKYRPAAGEAPAGMRGPEPVNRHEPTDRGVRYHNVSETFVLEYPGGTLPLTFNEAQGVIGHHYFNQSEGKRLSAIWITGRRAKTGKLLSLRIELKGEKDDWPVDHPAAREGKKLIGGSNPIGLVPALGLGWIIGAQLLSTGFLAGVIGAVIVGGAYIFALSSVDHRLDDRFDSEMSALRQFVGQTHAAPLDPSKAPA